MGKSKQVIAKESHNTIKTLKDQRGFIDLLMVGLVIILMAVGGYIYYRNHHPKKVVATPVPVTKAVTPAPTAGKVSSTKSLGSDSYLYTNQTFGYAFQYSTDKGALTLNETDNSSILGSSEPETLPTFYVSVTPNGFMNTDAIKTAQIYNYLSDDYRTEIYGLKVGAVTKSGTFRRLSDETVAGHTAVVVESPSVSEGLTPGGLHATDRRLLIRTTNNTYMIGSYYGNQTDLATFMNSLNTLKIN